MKECFVSFSIKLLTKLCKNKDIFIHNKYLDKTYVKTVLVILEITLDCEKVKVMLGHVPKSCLCVR